MIRSIAALLRVSLMTAMQYRASFWGEGLMALGNMLWTVVPLLVVYEQVEGVAGWTRAESLLVMGFFITVEGLMGALVEPNLTAVVQHVRSGTLDFILLKPLDAQLHISLHRTAPTKLPHALAGLGVVAWAAREVQPDLVSIGASALLLLAGVGILHAVFTLVVCTSFWFVRVDNLSFLLRSALEAGRWPLPFYRGVVRWILTFLLPVGLMTTWPAMALKGSLEASSALMALAVALGFMVAARLGWLTAVGHYSSASS
ncbi:MAG: ABC-2 family transporter protein [Alphaproteobacteria bacterium]|nr:ABC-2 family transporter protein [Alphaproteobacteria bacterium]